MRGPGRRFLPSSLFVLVLVLALAFVAACARPSPEGAILSRPREIEFSATIHPGRFNEGLMMAGYHLVVWRGGRAHSAALLDADVSDRSILAALSRIVRPGPGLPMDAWERRNDPTPPRENPAPDLRAEGPRVEVLIRIPGRTALVPLETVLDDPGGRGLDLRFDGNEKNIAKWGSGCIVCLYSCPGGKVGNARYTERDYARSVTRFRTRPGTLPPDGTRVGVVLRIGNPEAAAGPSPGASRP